jgi:Bacterial protein of unknown function (DUF839)
MRRRALAGAASVAALAAVAAASAHGFTTSVKPYVVPVGDEYEFKPLLSVGDRVPNTSHPSRKYQMVGIPDGLGLGPNRSLFMNHELPKATTSEPDVGGPLNRGAFVSRYKLRPSGSVQSGERAYDEVFEENSLVGPAPDTTNSTPGFGRFCSGALAGRGVGFDRPIYLTGEEGSGADNFDGRGGQSVAIYGNELHTLPKLGHYAKENIIVMPGTRRRTVAFPMEDGPSTPDSQLWMYVGDKRETGSVLRRNGLDNGSLYVFVAGGHATEKDFTGGSITGHWVRIPGAASMSEAELEAEADEAGAFAFIRPEDAAASRTDPGELYFVTTGGGPGNTLGRGYKLKINPLRPTRPATLEVIYNADEIVAAGGDTAISPDNIEVNGRHLMVQEDGTTQSRLVMGQKGRDGSIWRFDLQPGYARERVAGLDPPGRDGVSVGRGVWETSGIINARRLLGRDSWLLDVQAHPPTTAPLPQTVEDGQLLLMRPAR